MTTSNTHDRRPRRRPNRPADPSQLFNQQRQRLMERGASSAEARGIIQKAGVQQTRAALELADHLIDWIAEDDGPDQESWLAAVLLLEGIGTQKVPAGQVARTLDRVFEYPRALNLPPGRIWQLTGGAQGVLESAIYADLKP